jgi:hypothetical protein
LELEKCNRPQQSRQRLAGQVRLDESHYLKGLIQLPKATKCRCECAARFGVNGASYRRRSSDCCLQMGDGEVRLTSFAGAQPSRELGA